MLNVAPVHTLTPLPGGCSNPTYSIADALRATAMAALLTAIAMRHCTHIATSCYMHRVVMVPYLTESSNSISYYSWVRVTDQIT
jgi:hypothetical protein